MNCSIAVARGVSSRTDMNGRPVPGGQDACGSAARLGELRLGSRRVLRARPHAAVGVIPMGPADEAVGSVEAPRVGRHRDFDGRLTARPFALAHPRRGGRATARAGRPGILINPIAVPVAAVEPVTTPRARRLRPGVGHQRDDQGHGHTGGEDRPDRAPPLQRPRRSGSDQARRPMMAAAKRSAASGAYVKKRPGSFSSTSMTRKWPACSTPSTRA
jgi:hypothetical protein